MESLTSHATILLLFFSGAAGSARICGVGVETKHQATWRRLRLWAIFWTESPPLQNRTCTIKQGRFCFDGFRDDAQKAELVKPRYFGGLTIEETAAALGISVATAKRWWEFSRAWLNARLTKES